jgi:hypothetical protein
MVITGLMIIVIAVIIVLAVPRIWRKLPMSAAGREARSQAGHEAGSRAAAERKR